MQKTEFLLDVGRPVERKKHDYVFRQGDEDTSVYVVVNGLLKAYYVTPEGKEFVKSLILPGSFIGSMTACHANELCSFSLRCLEDSELVEVKFADLKAMAFRDEQIAEFVINGLLDLSMKKERREYEFLCLTAEERYQRLMSRSPEILQRVTQNDIARYLGITPVALSRIKARLENA